MGCLGNLLWFICGGAISGLSWCLAGCLWCITVVGIPVGMQCFKFASLSFFPFGKEVRYGGGAFSLLVNIVWLVLSGLPLALEHAVFGCLMCDNHRNSIRTSAFQAGETCSDAVWRGDILMVSAVHYSEASEISASSSDTVSSVSEEAGVIQELLSFIFCIMRSASSPSVGVG